MDETAFNVIVRELGLADWVRIGICECCEINMTLPISLVYDGHGLRVCVSTMWLRPGHPIGQQFLFPSRRLADPDLLDLLREDLETAWRRRSEAHRIGQLFSEP